MDPENSDLTYPFDPAKSPLFIRTAAIPGFDPIFVRRDFVAYYKQTILGPLWFLLQPLFTTVVFTIIFSRIAQISTDGLPPVLFYMLDTVAGCHRAECYQG